MAGESFVTWTLTPATTPAEVRALTGYDQTRDASDADVMAIIARAQTFVTHELSERIKDVALWGPIDGTNTRFELPPRMHGRVLLNASNSGNEKDDVRIHLRAPSTGAPAVYTPATVASTDPLHGQVVLSAAPTTTSVDRVLFSGWLVLAAVTKDRFKACVELYAAALLDSRVRGPGKVVLSNPQNSRADVPQEALERTRWWSMYQREVRHLRRSGSKAASVRTGMPDYGSDYAW